MNAPFDHRMSRQEFCRWAERQEARYEWVEGRVVMMTRVSRAHSTILSNLLGLLLTVVDRDRWAVHAEAFAVSLPNSERFPDLLVEPVSPKLKGYAAEAPVFVVEIQSSSSVKTDLLDKPGEYFALPSLQTYLVLSQDEPIAWVWQRGADGLMPQGPEEITGRDASVPVPALGVTLPLAEAYRGIPDPV